MTVDIAVKPVIITILEKYMIGQFHKLNVKKLNISVIAIQFSNIFYVGRLLIVNSN